MYTSVLPPPILKESLIRCPLVIAVYCLRNSRQWNGVCRTFVSWIKADEIVDSGLDRAPVSCLRGPHAEAKVVTDFGNSLVWS